MSDEPFLSGESGMIVGPRRRLAALAAERACELTALLMAIGPRVDGLAADAQPRDVLVLSAYRSGSLLPAAVVELRRGRHRLDLALGAIGTPDPLLVDETAAHDLDGGKFQNLDTLLTGRPFDHDWLLIVDDDVAVPARFLDRLIALCEHFELDLAQPAQTRLSHAAWSVTRRQPGVLLRETAFVEIGPVTLVSRRAAAELLPFPNLRFGWGLDAHWGAVARERGWRLGVADAVPVAHELRTIGSSYGHAEAVEEARGFLADRPFMSREIALRTLATHRRL